MKCLQLDRTLIGRVGYVGNARMHLAFEPVIDVVLSLRNVRAFLLAKKDGARRMDTEKRYNRPSKG